MSFKNIKEKFVMGKKGDPALCEDIIVVTEDYYAVIDGVTSKSAVKYNGMSSGLYGAHTVAEEIAKLGKNESADSALRKLDYAIAQNYKGTLPPSDERIQACAIIYSKHKREVWNYGDCALMINGVAYTHEKKIDSVLAGLRSLIINISISEGVDVSGLEERDFGREAIMPYLKKQALFANKDGFFGYPVIDGSGINASMIKIYKINEGDDVVLSSDGYPILRPTLEDSEKELKRILHEDPLSINENMQTKMMFKGNISFDDRAYLSFTAE